MGLNRFGVRRLLAEGDAGFAQEILKERIHSLETVRVARIVSQQDIILQKVDVLFHPVEKDEAVLAKFIKGCEVLSKEGAAGPGDDVVLDVHDDLSDLQPDAANDGAAGGLQFR